MAELPRAITLPRSYASTRCFIFISGFRRPAPQSLGELQPFLTPQLAEFGDATAREDEPNIASRLAQSKLNFLPETVRDGGVILDAVEQRVHIRGGRDQAGKFFRIRGGHGSAKPIDHSRTVQRIDAPHARRHPGVHHLPNPPSIVSHPSSSDS